MKINYLVKTQMITINISRNSPPSVSVEYKVGTLEKITGAQNVWSSGVAYLPKDVYYDSDSSRKRDVEFHSNY